jgi:hypothetical protein
MAKRKPNKDKTVWAITFSASGSLKAVKPLADVNSGETVRYICSEGDEQWTPVNNEANGSAGPAAATISEPTNGTTHDSSKRSRKSTPKEASTRSNGSGLLA